MNNIRKQAKENLPTLGEDVNLKNKKHLGLIVFLIIYIITLIYTMYTYRIFVLSSSAADSTPSATLVTNEVALDLYPQHYSILNNPNLWLQELTDAYYAYADLVGKVPYNGQAITIKEYPVGQMNGAEMYAGNPIHWLDSSVPGKLQNINNHNDLSFGPIHELGHDFDITPYAYYYIGNGITPINGEHWANFKLTYVADTLAAKYPTATFYQSAVGFVPIGDFSKKYFEDIFMQQWLASKSNWENMKGDAYTGFLHSLTSKYGWDMFKKTFRDYQTITDPISSDNINKVNLFVSLLSKNSGANIKQEFLNFGIPVSDYHTPIPTTGDLHGSVFNDLNRNGRYDDPGEPVMGWISCTSPNSMNLAGLGVTINTGSLYWTCDSNGVPEYRNVNPSLAPGQYAVTLQAPTGWTATTLKSYFVNVIAGGTAKVNDFGLVLSTPTPIPSPSASLDSDGDGFSNAVENYIGTNPNLKCGINAWPPDFNNDRKVTNSDKLSFSPSFNSKAGDVNYDKRHDLNKDEVVSQSDILKLNPYFNKSCTP